MSGGGSESTAYGGDRAFDTHTLQNSNFSSDQIDEFGKSSAGSGYGSRLNSLKNSEVLTNGGGYWSRGGSENITDVANAFNAWKVTQDNLKSGFDQYATLANAQQGRDATILGGSQSSPNVLGNPNPLSTPTGPSVNANVSRRTLGTP